jgi:hypothetical protein
MKVQWGKSGTFWPCLTPSRGGRSARKSSSHRLACIATTIVFLSVLTPSFADNSNDNSEYRVKLAFLYNFAQFVQWPAESFPNSVAPFTICVVGQNPFEGEIENDLRGRSVGGHPLELKTLNSQGDPRGCQIIFVRAAEMKSVARILALTQGASILTVGEAASFATRGGIINLIKDENRLKFEINIDAAAQTRLKISSKLLSLARIVKG